MLEISIGRRIGFTQRHELQLRDFEIRSKRRGDMDQPL